MIRLIRCHPRAVLAGLALLALGGSGAGVALQRPAAGAARPEAPAAGGVSCLGSVDVEGGTSALTPQQPGRVTAVPVHEGQAVKAGETLLRLDDGPARAAVRQAEAAVAAARFRLDQAGQEAGLHATRVRQQQAAVEAARHRAAGARYALTRLRDMQTASQATAQEVGVADEQMREMEELTRAAEARLAELNQSDPAVAARAAEAEADAAAARLVQARLTLDDCGLRAPEDGTVLRIGTRVGELAGGPGAAPAVLFCPDRPLVVRAEVEQEFIDRVSVGRSARVSDEANPALSAAGKVSQVAGWFAQRRPRAEHPGQFRDVPTVECVIALEGGHPPLRIGQRVVVTIPAPRK